MYVCGPTVYDDAHIGHGRSAVFFDVLARYLRFRGYEVTYVRNFTDIDDKIIDRAERFGLEAADLAKKYIDAYGRDMTGLHVLKPDFEPRVTDHVDAILAMVDRLVRSGQAYVRDGDVLYRVSARDDYGLLSGGHPVGDTGSGSRIAPDPFKEDRRDFVLWKKTDGRRPFWESPWGRGRPGWHIECVAMSHALLGPGFDIHGGGRDLLFPHHENERSIAMSLTGICPARFWLHHEMVTFGGSKISKSSAPTLPTRLRDLSIQYDPEAIRLFLLSTHYRRPLAFDRRGLAAAASALERLYRFLRRMEPFIREIDEEERDGSDPLFIRFCLAMDDDLNIPAAVALLFSSVRQLNKSLGSAGRPTGMGAAERRHGANLLKMARDLLGILNRRPDDYFSGSGRSLIFH